MSLLPSEWYYVLFVSQRQLLRHNSHQNPNVPSSSNHRLGESCILNLPVLEISTENERVPGSYLRFLCLSLVYLASRPFQTSALVRLTCMTIKDYRISITAGSHLQAA